MNNCSSIHSNPTIIFKDQKNPQKLIIDNSVRYDVEQIEVDGCAITNDQIRCDFLLVVPSHCEYQEYYIELKGTDLAHALKQILNTVSILSKKQTKLMMGFIICNRSPMTTTEIQNLKVQARKKNIILVVKSKLYTHKL